MKKLILPSLCLLFFVSLGGIALSRENAAVQATSAAGEPLQEASKTAQAVDAATPAQKPESLQAPATSHKRLTVTLTSTGKGAPAAATLDCIKSKYEFAAGKAGSGGVADYLARFYSYTNIFHKAKRCDSFVIKHDPAVERTQGMGSWYHVAVFYFDKKSQADAIRRLEAKGSGSLRTPAKGEVPGSLNFKGPTENYRIFFTGNRVVFFFFEGFPPSREEDPELRAAAQDILENCLKE